MAKNEEVLITNENYNVVEVTLKIVLVDNDDPVLSKLTIQPKLKEIFKNSQIVSIKDIEMQSFDIPYIYCNGSSIEFVYECSGKYFRKDGVETVLKEFVPMKFEDKLFVPYESAMYKLFENTLENRKHLDIETRKFNGWGVECEFPPNYHECPKTLPLTNSPS